MGNIANRYKNLQAQSVEELLKIPNLNRAIDLEAQMESTPAKREKTPSRFAVDNLAIEKEAPKPKAKTVNVGTDLPKALVGPSVILTNRINEVLVNAFKEQGGKIAKHVEAAMHEYALKQGWL